MNGVVSIEIDAPDDWHVHLRDDEMLEAVAPYTANAFDMPSSCRISSRRSRAPPWPLRTAIESSQPQDPTPALISHR